MFYTDFPLYPLHSAFEITNLKVFSKVLVFLVGLRMDYICLLAYPALPSLEDFNFNWFYIAIYMNKHKYDLSPKQNRYRILDIVLQVY